MRLNLGAGEWQVEGWTAVDIRPDADVRHDLSVFPWPFASASVDAILASHVLEHFTRADAARFLHECARVLTPGGDLHIAVPDLDLFVDCHLSGDFSPLKGYRWTSLDSLMGGGDAENNPAQRHRSVWCYASLKQTLLDCGFRHVRHHAQRIALHNPAYEAISLYVEAHW